MFFVILYFSIGIVMYLIIFVFGNVVYVTCVVFGHLYDNIFGMLSNLKKNKYSECECNLPKNEKYHITCISKKSLFR